MSDYEKLLHVFAAGNDGNLTCSPYPIKYATIKSGYQVAKNVLTVGALDTALCRSFFQQPWACKRWPVKTRDHGIGI